MQAPAVNMLSDYIYRVTIKWNFHDSDMRVAIGNGPSFDQKSMVLIKDQKSN